MTADGISIAHPILHHNRPQCSWAKFQVSMFLMERFVRYPITALMLLGGCFHIIFPLMIIMNGMSRSHRNINHQNPIENLLFFDQISDFHQRISQKVLSLPLLLIKSAFIVHRKPNSPNAVFYSAFCKNSIFCGKQHFP